MSFEYQWGRRTLIRIEDVVAGLWVIVVAWSNGNQHVPPTSVNTERRAIYPQRETIAWATVANRPWGDERADNFADFNRTRHG